MTTVPEVATIRPVAPRRDWPRKFVPLTEVSVARAKGRLNGKPPKLSRRQHLKVLAEYESGEVSVGELAEDYGVSRATIYRTVARARSIKAQEVGAQ